MGEKVSKVLFTPGPTNIPMEIREVLGQDLIHHRMADYHQLINSDKINDSSYRSVVNSASDQFVVISQETLNDLETKSSLMGASLSNTEISEIIIVVESLKTTKDWYREQYQFAKHYGVPVQVVHVY